MKSEQRRMNEGGKNEKKGGKNERRWKMANINIGWGYFSQIHLPRDMEPNPCQKICIIAHLVKTDTQMKF